MHWRFVCVLVGFTLFGGFTTLQGSIFSLVPFVVQDMFNRSVYNHYGVEMSSTGISSLLSFMFLASGVVQVLTYFFLLPLMDTRGRKFVAIHLKFALGVSAGVLQFLAARLVSIELFIVATMINSVASALRASATQIFLAECAPPERRGFAATIASAGEILGQTGLMGLSLPSVFGQPDKWGYLPLATVAMAGAFYLCVVWAAESPRYLAMKGRHADAKKAYLFYNGHATDEMTLLVTKHTPEESSSLSDVWADEVTRQGLILILVLTASPYLSSQGVNMEYGQILFVKLGGDAATAIMYAMITSILMFPLSVVSAWAFDKVGRRPMILSFNVIMAFNAVFNAIGLTLVTLSGTSTFTVIVAYVRVVTVFFSSLSKPHSMPILLTTEIFPTHSKIAVAKTTQILGALLQTLTNTVYALLVNIFPASFYFIYVICQPLVFAFLYRNLPETKLKTLEFINEEFENAVISREASRRGTLLSEKTSLLSRRRRGLSTASSFSVRSG